MVYCDLNCLSVDPICPKFDKNFAVVVVMKEVMNRIEVGVVILV